MAEEAASNVVPLGERLRRTRVERGLSQAQAARELDVARTAYRLWELEASKPAPDRWRLIASWLGISVSTMLLAEDLIDNRDAVAADRIAERALQVGDRPWDEIGAAGVGTFFDQERSTIARETLRGFLTDAETSQLSASLDRLESDVRETSAAAPARFFKELVADPKAPSLGRSAVLVTGAGLPESVIEDAELLTSELVTDSVQHTGGGSLGLTIVVLPTSIRVHVTDRRERAARPEDPGSTPGWGLAIVAELATRWGAGREDGTYQTWFEIDLQAPHR